MIGKLLSGDFLTVENPFSAEREFALHDRFNKESDRLQYAWHRTATTLPGAIIAVLLVGPIYKLSGIEPALVDTIAFYALLLPLAVLILGLVFGVPAFFRRRQLLRLSATQSGQGDAADLPWTT